MIRRTTAVYNFCVPPMNRVVKSTYEEIAAELADHWQELTTTGKVRIYVYSEGPLDEMLTVTNTFNNTLLPAGVSRAEVSSALGTESVRLRLADVESLILEFCRKYGDPGHGPYEVYFDVTDNFNDAIRNASNMASNRTNLRRFLNRLNVTLPAHENLQPQSHNFHDSNVGINDPVTWRKVDPDRAVYMTTNVPSHGKITTMYDYDSAKGLLRLPNPRGLKTFQSFTRDDVRRLRPDAVRQVLARAEQNIQPSKRVRRLNGR